MSAPGKEARIAVQRAASLMPLPALLTDLGTGLDSVLAGTGITADQLRPDAFIPYSSFLATLDNACRATGRDDIGLLLGLRVTLAGLGPLGKAMRHAATLGEAIATFVAFQINNSTGGAVYLIRADEDVILGYGVYDRTVDVSPQIYDLVLAVGCNLLAELTRGAVGPAEILLSRKIPGDPSRYRRFSGCPIRFDQGQTGLWLTQSSLAFRLPEADADLHERTCSQLTSAQEGSLRMSERVRHLLRPLMLTGQAKMGHVAEQLDLHPRALRRRLRKEGTSFDAIKADVRYAAARELLRLGALGLADIALTLDYESVSSFVHAFRRWSGMSPGQWRQALDRGQNGWLSLETVSSRGPRQPTEK